jgi:hypothetical protein
VPASSVSALNSWGTYMVAAVALLLMLSPALAGATRDSREGADLRNLDGVREVLSTLQPGVSLLFSFGAWPGSDPLSISGYTLSCSYGGGTIELTSARLLPDITLYPGVQYLAYLGAGEVTVVQAG